MLFGVAFGAGFLLGAACSAFYVWGFLTRKRVDETGRVLPTKKMLSPIVRTGRDEAEIEERIRLEAGYDR